MEICCVANDLWSIYTPWKTSTVQSEKKTYGSLWSIEGWKRVYLKIRSFQIHRFIINFSNQKWRDSWDPVFRHHVDLHGNRVRNPQRETPKNVLSFCHLKCHLWLESVEFYRFSPTEMPVILFSHRFPKWWNLQAETSAASARRK